MKGTNAGGDRGGSVLRLRSDIDWRHVQGDVVALDVRRAVYLATNGAGGVLWSRLSKGATREELVAALVDAFDVMPDQAGADVESFLRRLDELDVVEGSP